MLQSLSVLLLGIILLLPVTLAHATPPPIPLLALWESNMMVKGQIHCSTLMTGRDASGAVQTEAQLLDMTYYDAIAVYLQIYQYTGDSKWLGCIQAAKTHYRDNYVLRADVNGAVPGYWNFTRGMTQDFQLSSDSKSKDAVISMSQLAYGADGAPLAWTADPSVSRETAYAVRAMLNAEKLGQPRRARLADLVNQMLGHIDQWFISKTYRAPGNYLVAAARGQYDIQPFMVGLTMEVLIQYYEMTGDARVPPAIKVALDWLWDNAWVAGNEAFWYENWSPNPSGPWAYVQPGAPDQNLLIAPAYAWYYKISGDTTYQQEGDAIFAGGVKYAYLDGSKHFNQNYVTSFDYVTWRQATSLPMSLPMTITLNGNTAPSTVAPGNTLTLNVQNAPANPGDCVTFDLMDFQGFDGTHHQFFAWVTSGTMTWSFVAPATPGVYAARYWAGCSTQLTISPTLTVLGGGVSLTVNGSTAPITVSPWNTVTLNVQNAPLSPGGVDCVTLDFTDFRGYDGTHHQFFAWVTASTMTWSFAAPATPGVYAARYWAGCSTQLAISPTVTVTLLTAASATLSWQPSTSPNVTGYKVYYGTASQHYTLNLDVGNVTTQDLSLIAGATYYFAVTAHDASGNESAFSNEAVKVIP